jgi:hypothetical protein
VRPAAVDAYLRNLARVDEVVNAELADGEEGPANAIRAMTHSVTIVPTPAGSMPEIVVRGDLGSVLGLEKFPDGPHVGGAGGAGCPFPSGPPVVLAPKFTLFLGALKAA